MNYSSEEKAIFRKLYEQSAAIYNENQEKSIEQISPYSRKINVFIRNVKELQIYTQLNLKEIVVTRPSIILDIDPNYSDSSGVTNLSKMLSGKAPSDGLSGETIDLHHIGQRYDSPFAELPHNIHDTAGYYSTLHIAKPSWRNEKRLVNLTSLEISEYWKMRGAMYL